MTYVYLGFRDLESILKKGRLQPLVLQRSHGDLAYLNVALLVAMGDGLVGSHGFNIVDAYDWYKHAISDIAREHFGATISPEQVEGMARLRANPYEDSREFYRHNALFFSEEPLNSYDNFLRLDIPSSRLQGSPQGWPVVAGEVLLDDRSSLLVLERYSSFVKGLLDRYGSSLLMETY